MHLKTTALLCFVALALGACRKDSPATATAAELHPAAAPAVAAADTMFVDMTDSVTGRFPTLKELFAKEDIRLLAVVRPRDTSDTALRKDLGLARTMFRASFPVRPKRRSLASFDAFLWRLARSLGKDADIALMDSLNTRIARIRLWDGELYFYSTKDPDALFEPPVIQRFPDGLGRIRKSLASVLPATEIVSETERTLYPCNDMLDVQGRLFYQYQHVYCDDNSAGACYPRDMFLVDAYDGTRWLQPFSMGFGGRIVAYRDAGDKRLFLHTAEDTSGKAWHSLSWNCDEGSPHWLWQYRPSDGTLQKIDLDGPALAANMRIDTKKLRGTPTAFFDGTPPDDSLPWHFAMVRQASRTVLFRNRGTSPFDTLWVLPDSSNAPYYRIENDTSGSGTLLLRKFDSSWAIDDLEWVPAR